MKYFLFSVCVLFATISCKNRIEDNTEPVEQLTIKFELNGDFKDEVEELSTKADGDDIIGVQVYQKSTVEGDKYKPYCYGLWNNNMAGAEIKVNKGFVYRFEATMVQNARTMIASSPEGAMKQPFAVSGTGGDSRVGNNFIYSSANYFSGLHQGSSSVLKDKNYTLFGRPNINRYYTNQEGITINESMTTINLDIKRVVFGVKYSIIGFTEGKVLVEFKNSPVIELPMDSYSTIQSIICFQGSSYEVGDWIRDDYSELIEYVVRWQKADGTTIKLIENQANFQRKKLYTMEIDLTKTDSKGNLIISKEDDELAEGGVVN